MAGKWHTCTVDQIKAEDDRAIAIGPFGSRMKADRYVADGVPVIRGNNISDTRTLVGDLVFVSDETADELYSCNVLPGDLVFPHRGAIGQVGIIPSDQMSRYILSTSLMKLTCNKNLVDPLFIFYFFRSRQGRHALLQNASTVGTPGIGQPLASLRSISVPVPPLPEQRAIAHILGTLDDKIELNRRMNETLEAMARALFKSWFVDFDLVRAKVEGRARQEGARSGHVSKPLNVASDLLRPEAEAGAGAEGDYGLPKPLAALFPDSFESSELGEIPKGWKVGCFGKVVEHLRDQENPLSSPDDLFHHHSLPAFDAGQSPKLEYGETIKSHKSRVPAGVILLSKLNPEIERVWMVEVRPNERAVCSTEFLVLRARPPFARNYVYCLARSPIFRQQIEGLITGTSKSHQRAQVDSILNLAVVIPPSSIVTAFERSATGLLERTLVCRREASTLAALRDTLLPKLISGELRITQPKILSEVNQ